MNIIPSRFANIPKNLVILTRYIEISRMKRIIGMSRYQTLRIHSLSEGAITIQTGSVTSVFVKVYVIQ